MRAEDPYRIGPRHTTHRCIIHTHTHSKQAHASFRAALLPEPPQEIYLPLFIIICSLPLDVNTLQSFLFFFYRACLWKLASPNFNDAFTPKAGGTVWPSARCNIDRHVQQVQLRPFGCNVGRWTGVMSM